MAFLDNFLIPLIKTSFLIGIIGFIAYAVFTFLYKYYNQRFRWIIKYKIKKQIVDKKDLVWVFTAMQRGMDRDQVRAQMLIYGVKKDRIYEMIYLFDKLNLKGGEKNVRESQRSDKKTERTELP